MTGTHIVEALQNLGGILLLTLASDYKTGSSESIYGNIYSIWQKKKTSCLTDSNGSFRQQGNSHTSNMSHQAQVALRALVAAVNFL